LELRNKTNDELFTLYDTDLVLRVRNARNLDNERRLQSKFQLGDNVVVVGAGAIGLGVVQWLKLGGARHIIVLQPS